MVNTEWDLYICPEMTEKIRVYSKEKTKSENVLVIFYCQLSNESIRFSKKEIH